MSQKASARTTIKMTIDTDSQSQLHLTHPKYRPDIDGLRAIAVLSVVGFHAFPLWVKGGFIGVDIFFVISGFLISTIIIESLQKKSFSFAEFYGRRIRRIFPALLMVLVSVYALGWFVLFADEYIQLCKHIAGSAGFVSNFILWKESGYFDNSAETKPLLHLWSLGIEEQFYIVWPLLLFVAWRKRFNLLTITIGLLLISFFLNIKGVRKDIVATFYLPQTRFWELLTGSVLAWLSLQKKPILGTVSQKLDCWVSRIIYAQVPENGGKTLRDVQSIVGVILIALAIFGIKKEYSFPGWWALFPIIGALLIIQAGARAWVNRVVLSNGLLVWVGLISYPLYLWHWPILSFARIIEGELPSREIRAAGVVVSVLLAWLTYKLIEKPIRFGGRQKFKSYCAIAGMLIIGIVGYITQHNDGLAVRMKHQAEFISYFENERPEQKYFQKINKYSLWKQECAFFDIDRYRAGTLEGSATDSKPRESIASSCFTRDPGIPKSILLWGDSHAQALSPGLQKYLPPDYQLLQIATSACKPDVNSLGPSDSQCKQSNYFAIKTIQEVKPDIVVLAYHPSSAEDSPEIRIEISKRILALGAERVVLVGPSPTWKSDLPKLLARSRVHMPKRMKNGLSEEIMLLNSSLKSKANGSEDIEYADVIDVFCNEDGCLTYLGDDVKTGVTSWDYGHLTPIASEFLAEQYLVGKIIGRR